MINRKEFIEFTDGLRLKELSQESVISYTQQIHEQDYKSLITDLVNNHEISFYWSQPNEAFSFLAYKEVFSFPLYDSISKNKSLDDISKRIYSNSSRKSKQPLFIGGIKFPSSKNDLMWKNFDAEKWFIPKILLLKINDEFSITFNFLADIFRLEDIDEMIATLIADLKHTTETLNDADTVPFVEKLSDSEFYNWSNQINFVLEKISAGKLNKVVLARYKDLQFIEPQNILLLLQILEENFENCYTFTYRNGDSVFLGASPEKLFKISDGYIETDALAGSIPRGTTKDEDDNYTQELLQSKKNLAEHKSVIDFYLEQLTPVTEKILFDSQPSIKKYQNIQHLYSQIRAKLKQDTNIFSLLELLHPTPAVCGTPKTEALKTINELEDFDRGMYAGVLGWFNLENEGEFIVGIRSALLHRKFLRAFAGCGIVAGSESLSEYNETELKLRPILSLFTNETINKS
ncbi:MAG: isochorismate synthase [Ignavibacteriales bacterium]|nr:MAG: isochorismate synthase [Ignavibacteriales bacterium]